MATTIYLVGYADVESNNVVSIHRTLAGAHKAFDALRLKLLDDAKGYLALTEQEPASASMYAEMIEKLSEPDPEKINNYPHDTPYIEQRLLEDD